MAAPDKLLKPRVVAEILGCTVATLASARSTGRWDLEFVRVGRSIAYSPEAVRAFIERNTMTQTP